MTNPTTECLISKLGEIHERMVVFFREKYGECDEFTQWEDAFDLCHKYPNNKEANDYAQAALHQLIRTKHPTWKPSTTEEK